jgi:phosphate uptake regulator
MVALPKKWVKDMGLRQGSEIIITRPSPTSLLISADLVTPRSNQKDQAIIEVNDKDGSDSLFRKIVSLYVLGYNQISIRATSGFLSTAKRDTIKDLVRRYLIGTEGVADSKDKMTIHVLLGYSELSVDNALKKMLMLTTSMHREAISALERHDKVLAEGVVQRDDEVGRFGLYVIRQLNMSIGQEIFKESVMEPRDILGYTLVARALERIAHHASVTARAAVELPQWLPKSVVSKLAPAGENAAGLVEDALLSLFKRDHAGADDVVERVRKFVGSQNDLLRVLEDRDIQEYYTVEALIDAQRRIAEYARDIAETVLDLTVERTIRKEEKVYPNVS